MMKRINTYILNGKELTKKDLENYLVFEPSMLEENIKKILKYYKIKKSSKNNINKLINEKDLKTKDLTYKKIIKNNKIGFLKGNKKIISPLYDEGYFINKTFVMQNGPYIYV